MRKFFITDVFNEGKYSGNQLATVVDCDDLTTAEMQQIARQFNYSETTFLIGGDATSGYDVRIFTPAQELPFAGHPTLGTAYLIKHQLGDTEAETVTLNLGVGKIPVSFDSENILWMQQQQPVFGAQKSIQEVASALSLQVSDISSEYPLQFVSTGLEFLIVPLTSIAALKKCAMIKALGLGCLVFSHEPYQANHALSVRVFAMGAGVGEDPATGSANGDLAAYLVKYKVLGSASIDIAVGQGYEIDRPSTLFHRATATADNFEINIGGRVRLVAKGELFV